MVICFVCSDLSLHHCLSICLSTATDSLAPWRQADVSLGASSPSTPIVRGGPFLLEARSSRSPQSTAPRERPRCSPVLGKGFMSFAELNLSESLLRAVREAEYEVATPIQTAAIPHVLAGRDRPRLRPDRHRQDGRLRAADAAAAHATARVRRSGRPIRRLVLAPTRELASQIARELSHLWPLHGPAPRRHLWRRRPESPSARR